MKVEGDVLHDCARRPRFLQDGTVECMGCNRRFTSVEWAAYCASLMQFMRDCDDAWKRYQAVTP